MYAWKAQRNAHLFLLVIRLSGCLNNIGFSSIGVSEALVFSFNYVKDV